VKNSLALSTAALGMIAALLLQRPAAAQTAPNEPREVKGKNVTLVAYDTGNFQLVSPKNWVETNGKGSFKFVETFRDEWQVCVSSATQKPQTHLCLELFKKKIFKVKEPHSDQVLGVYHPILVTLAGHAITP